MKNGLGPYKACHGGMQIMNLGSDLVVFVDISFLLRVRA